MVVLDTVAMVAGFSLTPKTGTQAEAYRKRTIKFVLDDSHGKFAIPSIALSEYLFPFQMPDRQSEFLNLLKSGGYVIPFSENTATIAADLGRKFAKGKSLKKVAVEMGIDRVCLKADLLIVATALSVASTLGSILTDDKHVKEIAEFAKVKAVMIRDLPDPPPPPPPRLPKPDPTPPPHSDAPRSLFDSVPS